MPNTRKAGLLVRIQIPDYYEPQAVTALQKIGKVTARREYGNLKGYVEFYSDAEKVHSFSEIEEWTQEVMTFFHELGIAEITEVETYIVDRSSFPQLEFGVPFADEEGHCWVRFTFGGPRIHWVVYPLSDYNFSSH